METEKPVSKSALALMHKIERQIEQFKKLQAKYYVAKKKNPSLHIPFLENHTDESQTKSE